MNALRRLAHAVWVGVPQIVRRRPVLSATLADGDWLRVATIVAVAAPIVAFAVGHHLAVGRSPDDETYTFSLSLMATLAAVGQLGGAIGAYTWLGYVVGDVTGFRHVQTTLFLPTGIEHWTEGWLPIAISYGLLAFVVVYVPVAASGFSALATRTASRWGPCAAAVASVVARVVAAGFFAMTWVRVMPLLIRPIWSFPNHFPPVPAFQPLQHDGTTIVVAVMIVAGLRGIVEAATRERLMALRAADRSSSSPPVMDAPTLNRRVLGAIGRGAIMTLLFAGVAESEGEGLLLFAALASAMTVRVVLPAWLPQYQRGLMRVPLLLRAGLVVGGGYVIGHAIITPAFEGIAPGADLRPVLISIACSTWIAALLLPRPAAQTSASAT